jgi:hypothetical protein
MKQVLLTIAIATLCASGCGGPTKPSLTPLEIQALQTREFEAGKDVTFAATLSVFQDLGYVIESADKDTGFITASSPTTNTTTFFEALGGFHSNSKTKATAFVEPVRDGMTSVRLNFVVGSYGSSKLGQQSGSDTPILDAEIYQATFDRIDQGLFVRTAMREAAATE